MVDNARSCGDNVQIVLSLQTLLDHFQMKQSKETASETKSQCKRGLRLKLQGRIISLKLF